MSDGYDDSAAAFHLEHRHIFKDLKPVPKVRPMKPIMKDEKVDPESRVKAGTSTSPVYVKMNLVIHSLKQIHGGKKFF